MEVVNDEVVNGSWEPEDAVQNTDDYKNSIKLLYRIEDKPPWGFSMAQGLQHYCGTLSATLALTLILKKYLCIEDSPMVTSEILNNIFFVSGINTLMQNAVGVRLPIMQSGAVSVIVLVQSLMSLPYWRCPSKSTSQLDSHNSSHVSPVFNASSNAYVSDVTYEDRLREISGNLMVVSILQIAIGFSGISGILLRFIGPLTIAPTLMLIGLSLFEAAADACGVNWIISIFTIALIYLFSQCIDEWKIPIVTYSKEKRFHLAWIKGFKMFSLLLSIGLAWLLSIILTYSGALTNDKNSPGYRARSDAHGEVLVNSKWIHIPQPFKYGSPTVSLSGIFGLFVVVLLVIIECLGDFYATASICDEEDPPAEAINRGIGVTGIGLFMSGLFYSCAGATSYSENVATIGLTKVASRRALYCAAWISIACGVLGKVGAFFAVLPEPILGGSSLVLFGIIFSVGVSVLQPVDLGSQRNLTIVGTALISGFAVPYWVKTNSNVINTGSAQVDNVILMFLQTSIAVCCIIALFLDNVIPATLEVRGMKKSTKPRNHTSYTHNGGSVYDLPGPIQKICNRYPWIDKVPFLTSTAKKRCNNNYGTIDI